MKLNLRMQKKIPMSQLLLYVAAFCVFSFALIEHVTISIPVVSMVKMPLLYLGGICLVLQLNKIHKTLKKKKNFYVFLTLLLFCGLLYISAWLNQNTRIGTSPMHSTTRLVLYLIELFLLVFLVAELGWSQRMIHFLYHYVFLLTLVTDILLFTKIVVFSNGSFESYLVGTKFTVAYFHMNLFVLRFMRNKERFYRDAKSKRMIFLGIPLIAVVSSYVDCVTGLLGCLILLILFMMLNTPAQKKLQYLNSPVVLLLGMLVSVGFPFAAKQIMDIPFVQYLVESVMGRSNTLTGRLNIFGEVGREMQGRWLWGVGFGNGNAASQALFGYANAQNALLNWVLQIGIFGTAVLVLLMLIVFRRQAKAPARMQSMPLVLLVYVYILLGAVEITFSMSFLLWIALIFLIATEKKPIGDLGAETELEQI